MSIRTSVLVVQTVGVGALLAVSQVFLNGVVGGQSGVPIVESVRDALLSWRFWVACAFTGAAALFWMKVLASAELSFVYPVLVAASFMFVSVASMILFRESISPVGWLGIALILLGITLLARGQ